MLGGLVGVGGGILFVPALVVLLDQTQVKPEPTSLMAFVFVATLGPYRQYGYGNVRVRDGLVMGGMGVLGVVGGVAIANAVSGRTLELMFAALCLVIAAPLVRRVLKASRPAATDRAPERP